jgi:hypothetical protein
MLFPRQEPKVPKRHREHGRESFIRAIPRSALSSSRRARPTPSYSPPSFHLPHLSTFFPKMGTYHSKEVEVGPVSYANNEPPVTNQEPVVFPATAASTTIHAIRLLISLIWPDTTYPKPQAYHQSLLVVTIPGLIRHT